MPYEVNMSATEMSPPCPPQVFPIVVEHACDAVQLAHDRKMPYVGNLPVALCPPRSLASQLVNNILVGGLCPSHWT